MNIQVQSITGEARGQVEVNEGVFGAPLNQTVVHQALVRQLANARQGTASTKTRGKVSGSTRKLYSQKHTGRARRGDIRSPLLRGGGVTFGPHPRNYRQRMPKKMRRLALRCLLSTKLAQGELVVLDHLTIEEPKTKEMMHILDTLGVDSSALITTPRPDANLVRSTRNLQDIKVIPAPLLNVADLLSHKFLIMSVEAVRTVEQLWERKNTRGGDNAPL